MATLQPRGDSYRVLFQFRGKQHSLGLGQLPRRLAEAKAARVDELLALVKNGYLEVGPGDAVVEFLRRDGKPPVVAPAAGTPKAPAHPKLTLAALHAAYDAAHRGSLGDNTLAEIKSHFKHLRATLGDDFAVESLELADLQRHVKRRETMKNAKKKPVSPVTVQKDLLSFRVAWRWAAEGKLLTGAFPRLKSVRFGRTEEKLPFMTYAEVTARVAQGGDAGKLWECLYLQPGELADLLEHVRAQAAAPPWLHAMACLAAYTGVRRSEILRAEAGDLDLGEMTLTVREMKRKKGASTTRRVPVAKPLAAAMADWLARRPRGVPFLFAEAGTRPRSRTRGKTTGNTVGGHGRGPAVVLRETPAVAAVTSDAASDHLNRALRTSQKWANVRGWHTLRHSLHLGLREHGGRPADDRRLGRALDRRAAGPVPPLVPVDATGRDRAGVRVGPAAPDPLGVICAGCPGDKPPQQPAAPTLKKSAST